MNEIDITAPGNKDKKGKRHIISKSIKEIENIFSRLGFENVIGPEVESEFFNFDSVNVPKNHPARDMQDTFFIKDLPKTVLRTHTTGVQSRYMSKNIPPIRIISTGRVFRNESIDITHESQFHQTEGLLIGNNISFANLKIILKLFLKEFFENDNLELRIRPAYFPFVEPGVEIDMSCCKCSGNDKSCGMCKGSGWIEIGGAGMVHQNVLKVAKIDFEKYQGFAFGFGIERIVMLKYRIEDIRKFYDGDIPFIKQF